MDNQQTRMMFCHEMDILNSKAESIEIDFKMFDSNFEISRDVNCEIKVETAFSVKEELPDSDC